MITYLCPAQSDGRLGPCLAALPCEAHGITDEVVGSVLYGNTFTLLEEPAISVLEPRYGDGGTIT